MPVRARFAPRGLLCAALVLLIAASAQAQVVRPAEKSPATQPAPAMTPAELIKMADDVQKEVEALRGWKFKHPVRKNVRNEEELREFISKRVFEEELGGGKLEGKEALLRMVGLLPPDCDMRKTFMDVLLNQIGGFYDPQTKAFYMLVRAGVDYGPLVNRIMVAHELTHALDDQYFDLEKLMQSRETTEDWGYAIGSVVEGSATALMSRYAAVAMMSGEYDMNELQRVAESEMQRSDAFLKAPPYFSTLIANYLLGMHFLLKGDLRVLAEPDGEREVAERMQLLAKNPPETSEQILHPEKYWDAKERDLPVMIDDAAVTTIIQSLPGDKLRITHKDTLGELLCGLLTMRADRPLDVGLAMLPDFWTTDASAGWGGDRFFVLSGGEKPRGLWITAWDTARDRDEFVRAYEMERKLANRSLTKVGGRVAVYAFGFDAAAQAALGAALEKSPPAMKCDGKPWSPLAESPRPAKKRDP